MNRFKFLAFAILVILSVPLSTQTLYVDAIKGNDEFAGAINAPLASLGKTVSLANKFSGNEPIAIKIAPGQYTISTNREL